MPRAKKAKAVPEEIQWGGFLDLRLTSDEKAAFEDWAASFDWSIIDDMLADELKLSISFDVGSSTYLASLTSIKHAGANLRCVLTARASTWERSVMLVAYKHFVLLEANWETFTPTNGRFRSEV